MVKLCLTCPIAQSLPRIKSVLDTKFRTYFFRAGDPDRVHDDKCLLDFYIITDYLRFRFVIRYIAEQEIELHLLEGSREDVVEVRYNLVQSLPDLLNPPNLSPYFAIKNFETSIPYMGEQNCEFKFNDEWPQEQFLNCIEQWNGEKSIIALREKLPFCGEKRQRLKMMAKNLPLLPEENVRLWFLAICNQNWTAKEKKFLRQFVPHRITYAFDEFLQFIEHVKEEEE